MPGAHAIAMARRRACDARCPAASRERAAAAPRAPAGFTLVELMVVLVILGLAGSAVALTLPDAGARLDRQAERLGSHLLRAREEAILGTRMVELVADPAGYRFGRQRFGGWQPLHEGPFAPVAWDEGVRPEFDHDPARASFRFDPVGGARPQALVLGDGLRRLRVAVDGHGRVRIDPAGAGAGDAAPR
jgi:general secretion pathway protein H